MEMEYQYHHSTGGGSGSGRGGEGGRGRIEASLSNSSSSDLNHSSSSNSISASLSNSNSRGNQNQHRQNHQMIQQQEDPMQSWWESVSKARSRIQILLSLLPPSDSLSSLADSDRPARSLLDSFEAYSSLSSALSGSGDDPLCQWLYDTFLQSSEDSESESDLRLVVLSLVPLIAGLYLSRIHSVSTTSPVALGSPSLAGFEAVLLALYSSETKSRAGKPLLVRVPSPTYLSSNPSLYHTPTPPHTAYNNNYTRSSSSSSTNLDGSGGIRVGVLSPPLEPQIGIKSTKRACIVGVAFHCFFKHISQMPPWSKIDLCRFAASWAGDDCPCAQSLDFHPTTAPTISSENYLDDDDDAVSVSEELVSSTTNGSLIAQHPSPHQNGAVGREIILSEDVSRLDINGDDNHKYKGQSHGHEQGVSIPLPWELLQPLLRILGHCLLAPPSLNTQEIKDVASVAVRRLYARASHDLAPQAILATRSLVQLDNRARAVAAAALITASSNPTTPKTKKPEVLLVSK